MTIRTTLASFVGVLLMAGVASAGIITSTNTIVKSSPLTDVREGQEEDNTNAQAFLESEGALSSALDLDITNDGTFGSSGDTPIAGSLAAGTLYRSYYVYTDPVGDDLTSFTGDVTFSTPILGLIVEDNSLANSDPIVGASGTTYPTTSFRGLEFNVNNPDTITLSSDFRTVSWDVLQVTSAVDGIRVVTAVPEPSTAVMAGLGLAGLGAFAVRRRRRQAATA